MEDCRLLLGDSLAVLPTLEAGSVDACVTDPPYHLTARHNGPGGFMGVAWDGGDVAFRPETWGAVMRVAKPAAYLLAFSAPRTYHRLACAIEDAGWELRDCLCWLYGGGMPKSKSSLKPAWESILLARKPGPKVLPLGIEECRVPVTQEDRDKTNRPNCADRAYPVTNLVYGRQTPTSGPMLDTAGRWPANVVHDGSEEVLEAFAVFGEKASGKPGRNGHVRKAPRRNRDAAWRFDQSSDGGVLYGDSGSAARFFFCGKASRAERGKGNVHVAVKPLSLMEWLCRLVTPPGGLVLDPFAGSGTTGLAALRTGCRCILIEKEPEYVAIARKRLAEAAGPLFAAAGGVS